LRGAVQRAVPLKSCAIHESCLRKRDLKKRRVDQERDLENRLTKQRNTSHHILEELCKEQCHQRVVPLKVVSGIETLKRDIHIRKETNKTDLHHKKDKPHLLEELCKE